MEFQSDRHFQVWDYKVSHARMLIRSPIAPGPDAPTNIDILFFDVDFLNLPTSFQGLTLSTVPRDEADRTGAPRDQFGGSNAFRLETEGQTYYIVAFACLIFENELDLLDSSLAEPWEVEPRQDLGRLLARS